MTPSPGQSILLVDDDDRLRDRLAWAFEGRGFRAAVAGSYDEALVAVSDELPDLALLDLRMPGRGGLELLSALLVRAPELQVVVLTGYASIPTAVEAVRLGAVNYLQKPADVDMILAAFSRAAQPNAAPPDYDPPSLARAEWEHIQRVLDDCDGNITRAAEKLGLHRRTLQRKLKTMPPRT